MLKKLVILAVLVIIVGLGVFFVYEKQETAIKESSTIASDPEKKICDGKENCTTESEYQKSIQADDYKCKYYVNYIWSESERAYGKKQYRYTTVGTCVYVDPALQLHITHLPLPF